MSELPSDRQVHFSVEGRSFSFKFEDLCEASDYFQAMLSGNFRESQENTIVLKEIDYKMFRMFYKWMTVKDKDFSLKDLETDELLQLIHLVDRLFVHKLMQICNLEVVKRLENKKELFNEYGWKDQLSKSKAVELYCHFIEVAVTIANVELKDLCVKCLFSICFKISEDDTIDHLEDKKRQLENLTEVEQIKDIYDALSEPALYELNKTLTKKAIELLEPLEEQIRLKKIEEKEKNSATEVLQKYFRRYLQRIANMQAIIGEDIAQED